MRLTQKNEFFEYVLPEQNIAGDNQASEISLGETDYTCKKYVVGEAIRQFGLIEDVLEKYGIENVEDYISALIELRKIAIEESQTNFKRYIDETIKREKLEQELADLKQNAVVSKFKIGQKIFFVDTNFGIGQGTIDGILTGQGDEKWVKYLIDLGNDYKDDIRVVDKYEEDIFATRKEAEQALAEIGGKDEQLKNRG